MIISRKTTTRLIYIEKNIVKQHVGWDRKNFHSWPKKMVSFLFWIMISFNGPMSMSNDWKTQTTKCGLRLDCSSQKCHFSHPLQISQLVNTEMLPLAILVWEIFNNNTLAIQSWNSQLSLACSSTTNFH